MNEPKKRGRPSKAEIEAREFATRESAIIDLPPALVRDTTAENYAQAYALRVWAGQSPSAMDRKERIERVRLALEGQGLSMEGVELP